MSREQVNSKEFSLDPLIVPCPKTGFYGGIEHNLRVLGNPRYPLITKRNLVDRGNGVSFFFFFFIHKGAERAECEVVR